MAFQKNTKLIFAVIVLFIAWYNYAGSVNYQFATAKAESTPERSQFTLSFRKGVGHMEISETLLDAPPPGTGLPSGSIFYELFVDHAEALPELTEKYVIPFPVDEGPIRSVYMESLDNSIVFYFECNPGTSPVLTERADALVITADTTTQE